MNNKSVELHEDMLKTAKGNFFYLVPKRLFDLIFSIICLIILSPLMLLIAFAIKLDSKGPVFFKHKRIGKKGKHISIYKFRTMVTNAEELLKTLTIDQQKEFQENFKLENDFRITKIGKFLRKTSLDELPQLINIVLGEMSLVGPRPIIAIELEKYGPMKDKFLSVTPGLTGFWQANGRSNTTYEERIDMELYYVDHCSLWLDLKIILKTVVAVLRKDGAM